MGLFEGKAVLVTGAAGGMGERIAQSFHNEGANVVLFDRDGAALDEAGGRASYAEGGRVITVDGDVTSRKDVRNAVSAATKAWGRLDVVVAQAGIGGLARLDDLDDETWGRMIEVNLTGIFLTVQEGARAMTEGGSIVATASTNAFFVEARTAHYSASKGGVRTFVRAAAMELAERGIRINVVHPGIIRTPLASWIDECPDAAADYLRHVPMKRFGSADEVAQVVMFLASDAASYMTGADIVVDGGASLGVYLDLD